MGSPSTYGQGLHGSHPKHVQVPWSLCDPSPSCQPTPQESPSCQLTPQERLSHGSVTPTSSSSGSYNLKRGRSVKPPSPCCPPGCCHGQPEAGSAEGPMGKFEPLPSQLPPTLTATPSSRLSPASTLPGVRGALVRSSMAQRLGAQTGTQGGTRDATHQL